MNVGEFKQEFTAKYVSDNFKIINSLPVNDKRKIEELPLNEFLAVLSFKSTQFGAPCFERRLELKGCKKVSPSLNKGDFIFPTLSREIELKTSFPNTAKTLNIRQIRLWQDCDYIVTFCDYNNHNHKTYFLTHDQMVEEVEKRGCATHGTKDSNSKNTNIEYSITLGNKEKTWDKYLRDDLNNFIYT